MTESETSGIPAIAKDPYVEVFGRFWDGMSFLTASSRGAIDRLAVAGEEIRFTGESASTRLDTYLQDLQTGIAEWPVEFLVWQSFAHTIVEAHGLLDEYLRACFELFALAKVVDDQVEPGQAWGGETGTTPVEIEQSIQAASEKFEQLDLRNRIARLGKSFGVKARFGRPLEAALKHHRGIRNGIVHGKLTPHVIMPDGTIGRMRSYPPPPYVPLGRHVVRGAMSVMLAAHREVDAAIVAELGLEEDPVTATIMQAQVEAGREDWFADPWEPHPEHLFDSEVLWAWRPGR